MDSTKLNRILQSIGKGCFVEYFEKFNNPAYSNQELIELLMQEKGYTENGSKIRVSQSRRIIKEKAVTNALNNIIMSANTKPEARLNAKKILAKL